MIRALQKKFIVTAMIAVTVLLTLLLGALNAANAWSSNQDRERLLDSLLLQARRPGPFAQTMPELPDPPEAPEAPPEGWEGDFPPDRSGFFSRPLTEDDRMAAVYFTAQAREGKVTSVNTERISSVSEDEAAALAQTALQQEKTRGTLGDFRYAAADAPGGETVLVFLETSARRQSVVRVALLSAAAGAVGWGLMLLLVVLLSKKAIRPIAANMERQRQFITDAGHELKTPLAVILANTEAMELLQGESKWSRSIKVQTHRLTDLTQNLLTLARTEELPVVGAVSEVELSELCRQTAQTFSSSVELKKQRLSVNLAPSVRVRGDARQLQSLCTLLCDNAVKYAPEGGEILLRLSADEKRAILRLENDCDALPDCPPEQLFDRFYRADAARTQHGPGGFGIGLSAASVIVKQHRGTITAEYLSGSRIAFEVTLPLAG